MAIINSWESSQEFDNELSKIEHYSEKHHSEMMPFIGYHYNKSRILLVGESHFYEYNDINNQEFEIKYLKEFWYSEPTPDIFSYKDNFNTRKVIHNFLSLKRTKAHSIFKNPARCVMEAYDLNYVSDSEAFNTFAFMNYFQRPSLEAHESINNSEKDAKIAYNTFLGVCKVINPKAVVFLSKKAYECYINSCDKKTSVPIEVVCHPTCSHWNGKDGKEKFVKIINQYKENICFTKYKYYSKDKITSVSPKNFIIIKPRQCRFIKDKTTLRIYENSEGVYEFVAHMKTDKNKVGIGYNIEHQNIWIWNYDKKEYISIDDIKNYIGLNELYLSFCNMLEIL